MTLIQALSETAAAGCGCCTTTQRPPPMRCRKLLAHVVLDQSIDVTGPKLVLPKSRHSGQRLAELGVSISGTGRRDLQLEPGEIDQGQRDEPGERLGVSTCGMLVRRGVWEDLGGLDPGLPIFRDGVDFGWRAHLRGYRVVTTPLARMTHREVGRAGLRPRSASSRRPGKVDRQLGMQVVAAHAPTARLPLVWLRLVWSCLLHAVGYLLGKVPSRSVDELAALGSFVAHPGRIRAARRRVAGLHRAPGAEERIESLRPPWWSSLRLAGEAVLGTVSERYRSVAGDSDAVSLDELTGDDFSSVSEEKPKTAWLSPAVLAVVATAVASIVASRSLFGTGPLVGPALLPSRVLTGRSLEGRLGGHPGCSRSSQSAVACPGRARVHVHGWSAGVVGDGADLRDRAAESARRVFGDPPTDREPPRTGLGRRDLRAVTRAARRHQPGPALTERRWR